MGGLGAIGIIIFFLARRWSRAAPWQRREISHVLGLIFRRGAKAILLVWWLAHLGKVPPLAFALLTFFVTWLIAPTLVLRWLIVPLARPRFVYWVSRCSAPSELVADSGVGALYGAICAARRSASREDIDWLTRRLKLARSVRGSGVVAEGLLKALLGDRSRARCLFRVADSLPARFLPSKARIIARDWLVVDAIHDGNWREVIRLGRGRHSLRWSYAMARIAERLAGQAGARWNWQLWAFWIIAPRRRETLPLLRQAVAISASPPSKAPDVPDLAAALGNLVQALRSRSGKRSFSAGVREIEKQIDMAATRAILQRRLLTLRATRDEDAAIGAFRAHLVTWLSPLIEDMPHLLDDGERGPILHQAIEQARIRLFKDIELQCKDYVRQTASGKASEVIVSWESWAIMRDRAERLLQLAPELEVGLFQLMYVSTNNFGVLQTKHKHRILAHDMFSWLHAHSRSDAAAQRHLSNQILVTRG